MTCLSRAQARWWYRLWCCICSGGLLWLSLVRSSQAQITLDGSLGPRGPLSGPHYAIPPEVGQMRGRNLFHSFGQFNLQAGESATFTGPPAIRHILSRVTGGQPSSIDGTLRSTIPGAHLYLLNPNGVLFGPNATLDVQGSLHVSTADYLRLADGTRFMARLSETTTLSVAPPAAFGFLGPTAAPITVQGSALSVPAGETLALVGGDLTITGQRALTARTRPTLGAPGGHIHLASVASTGEALLSAAESSPGLEVGAFPQLGKIDIRPFTLLDASGDGGGTIVIRGGRLLVDNTLFLANTLGNGASAKLGIDVEVRGEMRITRGLLIANAIGAGAAGGIHLVAENLSLETSLLNSSTQALGQGGSINVLVADTLTLAGSTINTGASGPGGRTGNAGSILVEAPRVSLSAGSRIGSGTGGLGQGGMIHVMASDILTLDGSSISTGTFGSDREAGNAGSIRVEAPRVKLTAAGISSSTQGPGQGGMIHVMASDTLTLAGTDPSGFGTSTISTDRAGTGNAGSIVIEASRVMLTDGAQIRSTISGVGGEGGAVHVTAFDTLTLAGTNPKRRVPSAITADALGLRAGVGNAGNIVVEAPRVSLSAGARISSSTVSPGKGGTVRVTASDTLTLADGVISAESSDPSARFPFLVGTEFDVAAGDAGSVIVEAPRVSLTAGAQISSRTNGRGQGGMVRVTASDALDLTGAGQLGTGLSGILAITLGARPGAGDAGSLVVAAPRVSLSAGAVITSSTLGPGRGGAIHITASDTLTLAGSDPTGTTFSGIYATTLGTGPGAGDAGSIVVAAPQVSLTAGAVINSSTEGPHLAQWPILVS